MPEFFAILNSLNVDTLAKYPKFVYLGFLGYNRFYKILKKDEALGKS